MKTSNWIIRSALTLALGWIAFQPVAACDICAMFTAVTPNAQNNLVGVYFRHRAFKGWTHPGSGFNKTQHDPTEGYFPGQSPEKGNGVAERYSSLIIHGRWFLTNNWYLQAQIPFHYNQIVLPSQTYYKSNFGDVSVFASRGLLNKEVNGNFWRIFLGAGLKAPTGTRFQSPEVYRNYFELQGTTGSWDVQTRLEAAWRRGKHGISTEVSYRINTMDHQEIRYGNFLNVRAQAFRLFELKKGLFRLMPRGGLFMESYSGRYWKGEQLDNIGGAVVFGTLALGWFGERMNVIPEVQIPVVQRLRGDQLKSRSAVSLDWSINF